eukprot:GHVR01133377.1.p1 GENE.GHVR01133377.1~~GHVR01133377.1.p1  ORF type:complete len:263 (-),score=64.98 GHVR01133377.1:224-1012(-)
MNILSRTVMRLSRRGVKAPVAVAPITIGHYSNTQKNSFSIKTGVTRGAAIGGTMTRGTVTAAPASESSGLGGVTSSVPYSDGSVESRYAQALFRAATDDNILERVFNDLNLFKNILKDSDDLNYLINTPTIPDDTKAKCLNDIGSRMGLHEMSVKFLCVLMESRRLQKVLKVCECFEVMYRHHIGEVTCVVETAAPLDTSRKDQVKTSLEAVRPGKKVIVQWAVNPSILGGMIVRTAEGVQDFSVVSRLERISENLLEPVKV